MIRFSRYIVLVTLVVSSISSFGQNINTLAGNGTPAFGGDGSSSTAAKVNAPGGVVADNAGNVYLADYANNRIRKIDASGIITTIGGTGGTSFTGDGGQATNAQISKPVAITMDGAGDLYFTEDHSVVRKINMSTGIITTVAGIGSSAPGYNGEGIQATAAKLQYPWGVAFDLSGNLLIADQFNCRIRKVDMSSGIISCICGSGTPGLGGDGGPASAAMVQYPHGIAVSNTGNIYIADYGNNRIRKINTAGNISTITFPGTTSTYGYTGDGGPATAAKVYYPVDVTADSIGNVYIVDQNNNVVRKINSFGIISTIAGNGYLAGTASGAYSGDGGLATAAEMNQPSSVYVKSTLGKIYISDKGNNRLRVISTLHKPFFTNGHDQYMTICQGVGVVNLDTVLAVDDIDIGQTEIWTLVSAAAHGALVVGYTTTSTGGTLIPSSLIYTPFSSFYGPDSFSVRVFDGSAYDTTIIHINSLPTIAYNIIGPDSICPGDTATLGYVQPGGTWTSLHTAIANVTASGFVTALAPGHDTITYSFTNACGTVTAVHRLTVGSYSVCHTGVGSELHAVSDELTVFPNPTHGSFTLNVASGNAEEVTVVVTNILGEQVSIFNTVTNKPMEMQFDRPSGVYFISAFNAKQKFATKIITKL